MPIVDVLVPQMGEGLHEVLIVEFAKKPGEPVQRDEPIYHMETDKATMEVESPHEGVIVEWLASEGDVVPIGAAIARMEVADSAVAGNGAATGTAATAAPPAETAAAASASPASSPDLRAGSIPPRTRAYAKEKGLSDEETARIPASGPKLMPADIDAYLEKREPAATATATPPPTAAPGRKTKEYSERPLSQQDRTFIYRLKRSASMVVPAVAKRQMVWDEVRAFAEKKRAQGGSVQPSTFQCVAWCIAQAVKEHPKFRSTLLREDTVREFAHLNMGIAVATPTGELTIAVVPKADTLGFDEFVKTAQDRIQTARDGEDQADEATHLLLTYMGPYEITDAVPVLVAPAVAVLFIGSTFERDGRNIVNLALAFDHRLIHGVEAALFLKAIVDTTQRIGELVGA